MFLSNYAAWAWVWMGFCLGALVICALTSLQMWLNRFFCMVRKPWLEDCMTSKMGVLREIHTPPKRFILKNGYLKVVDFGETEHEGFDLLIELAGPLARKQMIDIAMLNHVGGITWFDPDTISGASADSRTFYCGSDVRYVALRYRTETLGAKLLKPMLLIRASIEPTSCDLED